MGRRITLRLKDVNQQLVRIAALVAERFGLPDYDDEDVETDDDPDPDDEDVTTRRGFYNDDVWIAFSRTYSGKISVIKIEVPPLGKDGVGQAVVDAADGVVYQFQKDLVEQAFKALIKLVPLDAMIE